MEKLKKDKLIDLRKLLSKKKGLKRIKFLKNKNLKKI